jgi:hypothetical protein
MKATLRIRQVLYDAVGFLDVEVSKLSAFQGESLEKATTIFFSGRNSAVRHV